jgi:glycine/D-amino acid oxidase-like deaminating enzyme
MQIITPARVHPVIVIGSGASGGMAAWNWTRQGIEVLLLDAGDKFDRAKFWTHVRPWQAQEREARGERPEQFFLDTKELPYLTPAERPFALTRVWGHGGKTNVWGPGEPALLADGSQGVRARRLGDPVADLVLGDLAVLRPGRAAHRRLRRHGRFGGAAGQQVSPAAARTPLR